MMNTTAQLTLTLVPLLFGCISCEGAWHRGPPGRGPRRARVQTRSVQTTPVTKEMTPCASGALVENANSAMTIYNKSVTKCPLFCYTAWSSDPHNSSKVEILRQGCWSNTHQTGCYQSECKAQSRTYPLKNTTFCCCKGAMCNVNFYNPWPSLENENTTINTLGQPRFIEEPSNKVVIIVLVIVSVVIVVVLVVVVVSCLCRPCKAPPLTPGQTSTAVSSIPEFDISKVLIGEEIARGRFSEVRKGTMGNEEVVVKIYQMQHWQYYNNEYSAFTYPFMSHENLIKFHGAYKDPSVPDLKGPNLLLVLDYMPMGSLTGFLKHNTIDWYTLCQMCLDIARGISHLHTDIREGDKFKPALAHRDINTRNILITTDRRCLITDLGFCIAVMGSKLIKNGVAEHAEKTSLADVGTLRYMAPEVLDGAVNLRDCESSLKQIDMYCVGMVLWELASRCVDLYQGAPVPDYMLPFQAEVGAHPSFEEMQVLVVKHKSRPKFPDVWKDSNPAVASLKGTIEDCWDSDSEARLTALCVKERLSDMASLWLQSTRQRGVTPTLNATLNLCDGQPSANLGTMIANGKCLIPAYIDSSTSDNTVLGTGTAERGNVKRYSSMTPNKLSPTPGQEPREDTTDSVKSPLIANLDRGSGQEGSTTKTRSWLQDQSLSDSTISTILPPTPSDNTENDSSCASTEPSLEATKSSNVILSMNKAVISHPNQGYNPTVERNTHRSSEEELTVSGNCLVGPGKQAPVYNVFDNQSSSSQNARPNLDIGDDGGFVVSDTTEFNSLVQHDMLNHSQHHHQSAPIPYLQNQVGRGVSNLPSNTCRVKMANITGNGMVYQQQTEQEQNLNRPSQESQQKSFKHKLEKFMKPQELGNKLVQLFSRERGHKNQTSTSSSSGSRSVKTNSSRPNSTSLLPNPTSQYVNRGLETSPVNSSRSHSLFGNVQPVSVEVQMVDGLPVTTVTNSEAPNSTSTVPPVAGLNQLGGASDRPFVNTRHSVNQDFRTNSLVEVIHLNEEAPREFYNPVPPTNFISSTSHLEDLELMAHHRNMEQNPSPPSVNNLQYVEDKHIQNDLSQTQLHKLNSWQTDSPCSIPSPVSMAAYGDASTGSMKQVDGFKAFPKEDNFQPCNELTSQNKPNMKEKNVMCYLGEQRNAPISFTSNQNSPPALVAGNIPYDNLAMATRNLGLFASPEQSLQGDITCPESSGTCDINVPSTESYFTDFPKSSNANLAKSASEIFLDDKRRVNVIAGALESLPRPQSLSLKIKGHNFTIEKKSDGLKSDKQKGPASNKSKPGLDKFSPQVTKIANEQIYQPDKSNTRLDNSSQLVHMRIDQNHKKTSKKSGKKSQTKLQTGEESSQASTKIRQRIKTPLFFKNARLSLYDDRLMSQSLTDNSDVLNGETMYMMSQSLNVDSLPFVETANEDDNNNWRKQQKAKRTKNHSLGMPKKRKEEGHKQETICTSNTLKVVRSTSDLVL